MKSILYKTLIALAILSVASYPAFIEASIDDPQTPDPQTPEPAGSAPEGLIKPQELLVEFKPRISSKKQKQLKKAFGIKRTLRTIGPKGKKKIQLLEIKSNQNAKSVLKKFRKNSDVKRAELNGEVELFLEPNDEFFPSQWWLYSTLLNNQTIDADIDAPEAWDYEDGSTYPVRVAVIDSGVDRDHPDLTGRISNSGYNFVGVTHDYANWSWALNYDEDHLVYSQSIKGTGATITHLGVALKQVGIPPHDVLVSIRDSITGGAIASYTATKSDVASTLKEVYKELSPHVTLEKGNTYFIDVRPTSADSPTPANYFTVGVNSPSHDNYKSNTYMDGRIWRQGADDWYYYDDIDMYFRTNRNNKPHDDKGHGTAVSGIIAAKANNSIGIAGVSNGAIILPLRALDASGKGELDDVIDAIYYAADNNAKVINMSLGGTAKSDAYEDAINYAYGKGIVLVAAAGNEGDSKKQYPASYPHVISVGATDSDDKIADFSTHNDKVTVAAPGVGIISTSLNGLYAGGNGTSFAAPLVSGVAALIWSRNPTTSTSNVYTYIRTRADDKGATGRDDYYGHGRLNAYLSVAATPRLNTTISFSASRTTVVKGQSVQLNIRLRDEHGGFPQGRTVSILRSNIALTSGQTDILGRFSYTMSPNSTRTYKAIFAGDIHYAPVTSGNIVIKVVKPTFQPGKRK